MADQIILRPAGSALRANPIVPVAVAYNAAVALADDLLTAAIGLHLTSLDVVPEDYFAELLDRFPPEAGAPAPIADAVRARLYDSERQRVAEEGYKQIQQYGGKVLGYLLPLAELADRTLLAPSRFLTEDAWGSGSPAGTWGTRGAFPLRGRAVRCPASQVLAGLAGVAVSRHSSYTGG